MKEIQWEPEKARRAHAVQTLNDRQKEQIG